MDIAKLINFVVPSDFQPSLSSDESKIAALFSEVELPFDRQTIATVEFFSTLNIILKKLFPKFIGDGTFYRETIGSSNVEFTPTERYTIPFKKEWDTGGEHRINNDKKPGEGYPHLELVLNAEVHSPTKFYPGRNEEGRVSPPTFDRVVFEGSLRFEGVLRAPSDASQKAETERVRGGWPWYAPHVYVPVLNALLTGEDIILKNTGKIPYIKGRSTVFCSIENPTQARMQAAAERFEGVVTYISKNHIAVLEAVQQVDHAWNTVDVKTSMENYYTALAEANRKLQPLKAACPKEFATYLVQEQIRRVEPAWIP